MKKLWNLKNVFNNLELEGQGRGIIMGGLFYSIQTNFLYFFAHDCSQELGQFQGLKEINWWVFLQVLKICIIRRPTMNCLSRPSIYTTVLNNKSLFKDKSALWLTIRLKIARPLCVCGIAHREFMSIFHTLQFDEIFLQIFFASLADFNLLPIIWIFYAILSTGQKITSSWFSAVFINSII